LPSGETVGNSLFLREADYAAYLELVGPSYSELGVAIWYCCLTPNHVHLIAVPKTEDGPRRAIAEAHRRYSRQVNFREEWRGHLWQKVASRRAP